MRPLPKTAQNRINSCGPFISSHPEQLSRSSRCIFGLVLLDEGQCQLVPAPLSLWECASLFLARQPKPEVPQNLERILHISGYKHEAKRHHTCIFISYVVLGLLSTAKLHHVQTTTASSVRFRDFQMLLKSISKAWHAANHVLRNRVVRIAGFPMFQGNPGYVNQSPTGSAIWRNLAIHENVSATIVVQPIVCNVLCPPPHRPAT